MYPCSKHSSVCIFLFFSFLNRQYLDVADYPPLSKTEEGSGMSCDDDLVEPIWLNSVMRRSRPDGCLRRSAGPAPPHTAWPSPPAFTTSHTHLPAPPLYPGLQGSLGPSSFWNLASSTILISSLLCGFLSLTLTFHHVSICVLASQTCWRLPFIHLSVCHVQSSAFTFGSRP